MKEGGEDYLLWSEETGLVLHKRKLAELPTLCREMLRGRGWKFDLLLIKSRSLERGHWQKVALRWQLLFSLLPLALESLRVCFLGMRRVKEFTSDSGLSSKWGVGGSGPRMGLLAEKQTYQSPFVP